MSSVVASAPPAREDGQVYSTTRMGLHWLMSVLLCAAFSLGLYMHDLALTPTKLRLFNYHKWLGITIFVLAVARVWARAVDRTTFPRPPGPRWQHLAAREAHLLLYVLLFAVPLSGWIMSSADGFQTVLFGVLPIPDLVPKSKELAAVFKDLHKILNFLTLAIAMIHGGAALHHHFVLKDGLIRRMLPRLR